MREHVVQNFLLGIFAVGIAFKAFAALRGIARNSPDRFAGLVHAAADAEAVRVARRPSGRRVELHQRQWKARGEEGRNAADRADLAFYIVERHIAFGRRVEFQDARNDKAVLKSLPDVGLQPVAAAKSQAMGAFVGMLGRVDQITAQLADILKDRAVAGEDLVPEVPHRKPVADQNRAAAHQQRAGRDHAADAVIERQAVMHPVVGRGVHEAGEPKTPLQQPPVADLRGFRQTGRAGGVDQERAVGDRHRAAFGQRQRLGRVALDRAIDALKATAAFAVQPNLRAAHELRGCALELHGAFGGDDQMFRRDDVDAMGERMPAQLGIDQRNDDARAGEAEPDRQIFRPVRHHQADCFALGQPLIERPMCETVSARDERAIGQALAADCCDQRGRVALRLPELRDHVIEQPLRTGSDRRCAL
jgi:hypothetical protein